MTKLDTDHPAAALARVQEIVGTIAPTAVCELWDYEARIRCRDVIGSRKVEFDIVWRGLSELDIMDLARRLADNITAAEGA